MDSNLYTLKVNIRAQEEKQRREKERQTREAISKLQLANGQSGQPRKRRGLNFHEPGTFVAQGDQLRKKAKLEALQRKIAANAAKVGITDAAKLASLTTTKLDEKKTNKVEVEDKEEQVPEIEWWDREIIGQNSLEQVITKLVNGIVKPEELFHGITNLIEHPAVNESPSCDLSTVQIPMFLTAKERKKQRRLSRRNQELEKQEKIKLGLIPKPEPKLKRSSIMYALGDEAITNPSLAEQLVRDQEEKRLKAHLEHNQSKKLTIEEKRAKKLRKIQEDLTVTGVWVSVYKILSLSKQSKKLKIIEQKAKELTMTGAICLSKDINLVLVEGGPKQQRKFKQLILNRIKWNEDALVDQDDSKSHTINRCLLVWEGQVNKRSFAFLKTKQFTEKTAARAFFRDFNVEHYWDLAYKMSILESMSDT